MAQTGDAYLALRGISTRPQQIRGVRTPIKLAADGTSDKSRWNILCHVFASKGNAWPTDPSNPEARLVISVSRCRFRSLPNRPLP